MKRIIALLTLLCVAVSLFAFPAFAAEEVVEIKFRVGDGVLSINGNNVEVEKPYVVGSGVTLVPVRVITEAFKSEVSWDGATRTVYINYPDVKIELQIGNTVAEVNGVAETLLSAPEIKNNVTMVPLRFISETFGAEVLYDDKTREITVKKSVASDDQEIVEGAVDADVIGDSYYGWSMDNPKDMQMTDRNFDGSETSFASDENNYIDIFVYQKDSDYDFDKSFSTNKNYVSNFTLVKADKLETPEGTKYMHIQVRDKTSTLDIYEFAGEKYIYSLCGVFENENTELKNEGIRVLGTFKCSFNGNEAYDLSDVKDGMRTYESESLDFSMDIPDNFYVSSYDELENEVTFYNNDDEDSTSRIAIGIYSKTKEGSAKEFAEKDNLRNKSDMNKNIATISETEEVQYTNFSGYEYVVNVDGTYDKFYLKDVFFEIGDYVYNITCQFKNTIEGKEELAGKILNSFSGKEIDSEETGIFLRNDPDAEGTYTFGSDVWSVDFPAYYSEYSVDDEGGVYLNLKNGAMVSVQVIKSSGTRFNEVLANMKEIEAVSKKEKGVKITSTTKTTTLGTVKYADMSMTLDQDKQFLYVRELACLKNGYMVVFISSCPELAYTDEFVKTVEAAVETFKIK